MHKRTGSGAARNSQLNQTKRGAPRPADDEDDEVTDLTGAATAAAGQGAKRKAPPLLRQAPLLRLDRPVEQRRVLGGGWLYGAHRVRENMARQKTS